MVDYSTLANLVLNKIKSSSSLLSEFKNLVSKYRMRTIRYQDAIAFSEKLGTEAAAIIKQYIGDGSTLELDRFAEEFIEPVYTSLQNTTLSVARNVQEAINEVNELEFAPALVKCDRGRVQHILARFRETTSFDAVSFLLEKDVINNITRSAVNDTVQANADLQSEAGFDVCYTRSDNFNCCEWCASMTGTYKKGEEPLDFWKVHKNCSCEFEYESKLTGTHSKITFSTNPTGKLSKNTSNI